MQRFIKDQNTWIGQRCLDGVRANIRQLGNTVLLDNARGNPLYPRHDKRRVVRHPVIGVCLALLGAVFGVGAVSVRPFEAGQMVVGLLLGLAILLAGYVLTAYRDAFQVNTATGQWRQTRRLAPFLQHTSGSLGQAQGLRICRESRTAGGTQAKWVYDVYAVQIIWKDPTIAPLTLYALDLPCDDVAYDQAAIVWQTYGAAIGLSLLDPVAAIAQKNTRYALEETA